MMQDWSDYLYYANSPGTDPKGPAKGSSRVYRGGSWLNLAEFCRSGNRDCYSPDYQSYNLGFRLALSPE